LKILGIIVAAATLLTANVGLAAQQTVTLAVENMDCVSCPYIVKQSLKRLSGVRDVIVSFENKTATVTYDDAATGVAALIAATTDAGYPSHVAN